MPRFDRQTLILRALSLALLASPAVAQQSSPADWECLLCVDDGGWFLDADIGAAVTSDDRFRFGNGTGLDEDGGWLFGDLEGRFHDDRARYFRVDGYLRGDDNIGLFLNGGQRSRWNVSAAYQAIPIRQFDTTTSPYSGGIDQTLPPGWVTASTTQGMTELATSTQPRPIGRDVDVFSLGVGYAFSSPWDVQVDVRHREEKGTSRLGTSFLFNAIELAAPVDQSVSDLDASIGYSTERWQARIGYFASTYDNNVRQLSWENAYSVPFGVTDGALSALPDNDAHSFTLSGAVALPSRTTVSASFSTGRMEQNEALLNYTINPAIPVAPLPVSSPRAKVDTKNAVFRVTSSPWRRVTLEGEYRSNDHDNETAQNSYDVVVTDTVSGATVVNPVFSYDQSRWKLRGEFRPSRALALNLGFSSRDVTREQQDRRKTDTDKVWFELRTRIPRILNLKGDVYTEDRDGSSFSVTGNAFSDQNPLMRKYNLADRERDGVRIRAALLPFERFDLSMELESVDDDYENSTIGLTESESRRFTVDTSWVNGDAVYYASGAWEDIQIDQQNSQSFSTPDWAATNKDRFVTGTIGVTWRQLFGMADLEVEYSHSKSTGRIDTNTSGLESSFPALEGRRQTGRFGLSIPVRDSVSIGAHYFYERVRNDDWALDGALPDTVPTLLSLGAEAFNYKNNVVYLSVRYRR